MKYLVETCEALIDESTRLPYCFLQRVMAETFATAREAKAHVASFNADPKKSELSGRYLVERYVGRVAR